MITWLQARNMIVDFAHMNRPTFWDAIKLVQGPIYVSHGNACAHCPSPRNLADDQLHAVAASGGVVGIFFANTYVVGRGKPGSVIDVARHIDHCVDIMGIEHIALGTDFGGIITGLVKGLESVACLPHLWEELSHRGYSNADMELIAWKNAARVLDKIL
jgi:membrane dipeptidase